MHMYIFADLVRQMPTFSDTAVTDCHSDTIFDAYSVKISVYWINPTALRTAKTLWSFGFSECNRVGKIPWTVTTHRTGVIKPSADNAESIYSQTCLKGSPKGRTKSGCLRQVTP